MNYTVKYSVNSSDPLLTVFSYWNLRDKDFKFEKLNGTSTSKPRVLRAANISESVVTKAENQTRILFVFGIAKIWYMLDLNNSDTRNMTLTNVSLPEVKVVPEEIVYTMGEKGSFQVQISKNLSFSDDFSVTGKVLTKVGTHEFVDSFDSLDHPDSSVEFFNGTKSGRKVANITMDMKSLAVSGVLTLKTTARNENTFLLSYVDAYRRVVIRPSNQSRPFEQDLFVFYYGDSSTESFANQCERGSPCRVHCPTVVGSNKTKVVMWYKENKYQREAVATQMVINDPFYVVEAVSGEIPRGVQEYFCNASRLMIPAEGGNAAKTITTITTAGTKIQWITRPKIVTGRVRLKEGDGAFYKTLRVTCSARGDPIPSMTIKVSCSVGDLFFYHQELDVGTRSGNFIRVSKDVILTRSYFGQTVKASCGASNAAGFDTKELRDVHVSY